MSTRCFTMRWVSCTENARKPARFGRCRIANLRENALRRSFTVRCPAPVRCVPGVRSAIGSVAFAKMQNGASYASRSTWRSFAPLRRWPRHPYRWKRLYKKHSALERINVRVGREFQLERHYMRRLETMQMRVALSLSVILAMACTSIREGQPQRMRSVIHPLAA